MADQLGVNQGGGPQGESQTASAQLGGEQEALGFKEEKSSQMGRKAGNQDVDSDEVESEEVDSEDDDDDDVDDEEEDDDDEDNDDDDDEGEDNGEKE
jgi:hypothetical protein